MTPPYPPLVDPAFTPEQEVRYSYWPVSYRDGDLTVIGNASLPFSGVSFSMVMRGVGEFRASLQLADDEVRSMDPWEKIIPRKTGIVVVREVFDQLSAQWIGTPIQHYIVWAAPRDPTTGRMNVFGNTVEALWARRLITRAMSWTQVDQQQIAADLLDPARFSLIDVGDPPWPGWITVDPPTTPTGVLRTFSYEEGQESNLLEAHQNRSQLSTNSYEWTTAVRVQVGDDATSAESFRPVYVLGFPQLGRQLGDPYPIPRLRWDAGGGGNVLSFGIEHDGSDTPNIVWGAGNGYEDNQVRTVVANADPATGIPEWQGGFLQTEARFSDPDVKVVSTLASYCYRYMWQKLSNELFVTSLKLRGDRAPFFGSYVLGDETILETNDLTWPTGWYNTQGYVELLVRIFGIQVTPPQGTQAETIELLISGGRS